MKKSIISAIAFLSLAACMQEEVVSVDNHDAIVFDNAFVENTTRATTSFENKDDLDNFNVWGFINSPKATLFEGTEVVKGNNGAWSYAGESRYWIPGQNYYFAALAPVCDSYRIEKFTETDLDLIFTNVDGNEDLIYAESHMVAQESGKNVPVAFQFQHLLSKVRFTFENKMGNEYINVRISDIRVKSAGTASIDLKADPKVWTPRSGEIVTLNFGSLAKITANSQANTEDYFVIPSAVDYDIEFGVQLEMDTVNGTEVLYTATKTSSVPGDALEMGTAYNFSTSITPDIFNFDCVTFCVKDVDGWNEASDLSKIAIASKLGGEVTLTGNVEIPGVIEVSRDLTINLNGKTLTFTGADRMFNVIAPATLTINGVDAEGNAVDGSSVVSTTAACIATANTGAAIVINGGDHQTTGSAAYYTGDGEISISAGRFYKWNPEEFLVGDLIVGIEGDWYMVKEPAKEVTVDNIEDLNKAIADINIGEISLTEELNLGSKYMFPTISSDCILNLNGNKITAGGAAKEGNNYYYAFEIIGCELTFNDADITGGGIQVINGSKLTYNGSHHAVWGSTSRYSFAAVANSEIIINGGSFSISNKNSCYYAYVDGTSTLRIQSGTFAARLTADKTPFVLGEGAQVIITGGTFGFDPSTWVADGYTATQSGSTWTVTKEE